MVVLETIFFALSEDWLLVSTSVAGNCETGTPPLLSLAIITLGYVQI